MDYQQTTNAAYAGEPRVNQIQTDAGIPITPENKIRTFVIREVSRGYIVEVGCQTFVFETKDSMLYRISQYVNAPSDTEAKWFNKELF